MSKFKEAIAPFKLPIILLLILAVVYIAAKVVLPGISSARAEQSPVVGIEAENDKTYISSGEVKAEDFKVRLVHENGGKTKLPTDQYTLSQTTLDPVGSQTKIIITYTDDSKLSCEVDVAVERKEVMRFECGYPDKTNVCAVLYSNGELCFEGKGDVYTYDEGKFPWTKYDGSDKNPIHAVSFQKDVKPTDMNYWFEDKDELTYVGKIPDSVKTMIRTFSDCESLESMADWTGDNALLNITECYEDCENLKQTCAIPESVKIAQSTFKGCKSLQETPDMSKANAIIDATGMYEDCSKLVKVSIPSNAENISSMFEDCINLKDMPEIPSTASVMSSTFRGDVSLTSLTSIPESVTDLSSCFADCQLASGPLVIDANAEKFSNMFDKAVLATKLDITGKSLLLDAYANTSSTGRVTVNGKSPNPDIKGYSDVIKNKK